VQLISFENTIAIRRPLPEVFQFVSDLQNLPKWNYFVLEVRKISPGPITQGTEFQQIRKTDQQKIRITQLRQPHALTVETVPPSKPELHRQITFSGDSEKTVITDKWSIELGIPPLLRPLGKIKVASAVRENLSKLKELLETGGTRLQDGRPVSA
jgi:hypothetical protein